MKFLSISVASSLITDTKSSLKALEMKRLRTSFLFAIASLFSLTSLCVLFSSFSLLLASKGQVPGSPSKFNVGHVDNSKNTGLASLEEKARGWGVGDGLVIIEETLERKTSIEREYIYMRIYVRTSTTRTTRSESILPAKRLKLDVRPFQVLHFEVFLEPMPAGSSL